MIETKTRLPLAAAAALLAMSSLAAPAQAAKGHKGEVVACYGVNACKGQSDCKTDANGCKGENECKGHGFKDMTPEACKAAGGSLDKPK